VKRLFIIEDLCNGCRLCETFCSSLKEGVFGADSGRIHVIKVSGGERDIPMVDCSGDCIRPIFEEGSPTCVSVCPTGTLTYENQAEAISMRLNYEDAKKTHAVFKIIAPWKWPWPWKRSNAQAVTSVEGANK